MTVAVLGPEDVDRYRALMLEAYARAPDAFTSTPQERAAEPASWWLRRIADPGGLAVAFGAFQGQALVGTVALEFSEKPKTRHKAHLIGMYVHPDARGAGVGWALVQAALRHLQRRADIACVTLTVTQGNESAIRLYSRAGFVEFGTEPMAIRTPSGYKAKVHMWCEVAGGCAAATLPSHTLRNTVAAGSLRERTMKDVDAAFVALRNRYVAAVSGRNVDALIQLYDARARIFDAWGVWEYTGTESWRIAIEGWFSSHPGDRLQVTFKDCSVLGTTDLAAMTSIVTYASIKPDGAESHSMQNRVTWIARTTGHNLRIVHEHTSAPIGFEDMKAILKKES